MGVYQFDLTFALCFSSKLFWNNIFLSEVAYGDMDVILFVTNFIFVFLVQQESPDVISTSENEIV